MMCGRIGGFLPLLGIVLTLNPVSADSNDMHRKVSDLIVTDF